MKKIKYLLTLVIALSIFAMPCYTFAATVPLESTTPNTRDGAVQPVYYTGRVIYNNVILNKTLDSNNVYLGQVNYGDTFRAMYETYTPDGKLWVYVYMTSGQNSGKYGWLYKAYTTR